MALLFPGGMLSIPFRFSLVHVLVVSPIAVTEQPQEEKGYFSSQFGGTVLNDGEMTAAIMSHL